MSKTLNQATADFILNKSKKKSKYQAVKTVVDGIKFDSKKEAARYVDLKLLERGGVIEDLTLQPRFDFACNGVKICFYKADFRYFENGKVIIEDVKGFKTPMYNLKKKMMKAFYGIDIFET